MADGSWNLSTRVEECFAMALFNREPEKNARTQMTETPSAPRQPVFSSPLSDTSSTSAILVPRANDPLTVEPHAYLDQGSRISGKLSFDSSAKIDGEIDGEIVGKESITIGESAVITATIRAESVIVSGKMSGDIIATQRIEIRPSAKVKGNITAPVIVVQQGALFDGHCSMQPERREERKVTALPKEERPAQAAAGSQSSNNRVLRAN